MMSTVFVQIKCELGYAAAVASDIVDNVNYVSEVYSTSGQYDLIAKFHIDAGIDVGQFIVLQLQTREHIRDTFTTMTFSPWVPALGW